MSAKTILSAENLSVGYSRNIVVDGIRFHVSSGQILTLIGPNGAGKSTILRTICKQLPAIGGTIAVCGNDLANLREKDLARYLSVMLTDRLSAERMTCGDVAATGRYPFTGSLGFLTDHDRAVVRSAMEMVGTADLFDRDFREISDGQRQCVMLARAIAQEPELLLLDEPTSFLDISHKLHILSLLRRLVHDRGIGVIQSLHELDLAQKFSDTVLCIRSGKADRIGTPEEIFTGSYISDLYGIRTGQYDPLFGTVEPAGTAGDPQVFVIGGGGAGISVYRRLQRAGIPFAAGVLHENDLEYPTARALASKIVTESAFEPITEKAEQEAAAIMSQCFRVICCTSHFASGNRRNANLRDLAEQTGKLITAEDYWSELSAAESQRPESVR